MRLNFRKLLALLLVGQVLFLAVIFFDQPGTGIVRSLFVVIYLTFVPGVLVTLLLGLEDLPLSVMAVYSAGLSFVVIMAIGGVMSLTYPYFGLERPFSIWPLALTISSIVIGLSLVVIHQREMLVFDIALHSYFNPLPLVFLLLPLIATYGSYTLEGWGSNWILLMMLVGIALLPLVSAQTSILEDRHVLAIWMIALALLYYGALWPFTLSNSDPVVSIEQGRWLANVPVDKGGTSVLPNGVLYPVYSILAGHSMQIQFNAVNPFIVSFLPVALFHSFKQRVTHSRAFLLACFFMFSFPFFKLYPIGGRIATPVLFLALVAMATSDPDLSDIQRASLSLLFGSGVVVSHYGTAYVVIFAVLTGTIVYISFNLIDSIHKSWRSANYDVVSVPFLGDREENVGFLSLSYVGFMSSLGIAWHMYTVQGIKFQLLPGKIVQSVRGVLYGEFTGSAARTVSKDYGSLAISLSRNLYIVVGLLMTIGMIVALISRLVYRKQLVDDEYLAISTGFMMIFGGSFLPSGTGFNVARVMMIVFVFSALFAILGLDSTFGVLRKLDDAILETTSGIFSEQSASMLFALLLAIFLLLNSGVVSATITHDYGPSPKLNEERLANSNDPIARLQVTPCISCDVETHVWTISHINASNTVYGDARAEGQLDYHSGRINPRAPEFPGKAYYQIPLPRINKTDRGTYLVFLHHNLDTRGFAAPSEFRFHPLDEYDVSLEQSDRIYASGYGRVYSLNDNPQTNEMQTNETDDWK